MIQTYQPGHYAVRHASNHDYSGFFQRELQIRQQFSYPPFSHIIRVLITGEEEKEIVNFSKNMIQWLEKRVADNRLLQEGLITWEHTCSGERIKTDIVGSFNPDRTDEKYLRVSPFGRRSE